MLFARFLAENHLLIEPEMGVAIALDECEELAKEERVDKWTLAARFAHRMLPQVFRPDHPVFKVRFAREHRLKLEGLVEGIPEEAFTATDSLGWVYQFWQAKKKDEVNNAGNKIGADELPAVTQLFTEDYMVDFLLDNTLGAWHAGKVLAANPKLAETAQSEDELRQAVSLPGCPWKYLRFIKDQDGKWAPAAGTFDGWPKTAKELKCLDPCMGSGHFVVAMFERLVALRMTEEKLDEAEAVASVIRDNLFGLELDPRCTQIGAFNLALAAWRRVGHCPLPAMNLACSGLAPNTRESDWLVIAGDNEKLQNGMERLYRLFQKAAVLGSLINPRAGEGDLLEAGFSQLQPLHVAVARLLGYQWPRQTGSSFPDCPALGPDGLEKLADDDGIVCVPAVRGEPPHTSAFCGCFRLRGAMTGMTEYLRSCWPMQAARISKTGCATDSSNSTVSCSITAPSSGTSGTAASATASMPWSTITSWSRATARAGAFWSRSPTATWVTGSAASRMA